MSLFDLKKTVHDDFSHIDEGSIYLDVACQTPRPKAVIEVMDDYYYNYNSCGERVKYQWGRKVDEVTEEARELMLKFLGKSAKEYVCSLTLNTTYGLNLVQSQLKQGEFGQIITSEIEHNSVFLSTMAAAKRLNIPRLVLERDDDGTLIYDKKDFDKPVVVVNAMSNFDGRKLQNAKQLAKDVHQAGGILIIDAAQAMAHGLEALEGMDYDAVCFSVHKMYGPSMGGIVFKKTLLERLEISFIGGGMVEDVRLDDYDLIRDEPHTRFEAGLQNYAGAVGLSATIKWLQNYKPTGAKNVFDYEHQLSRQLYEGLSEIEGLTILGNAKSSLVSIYHDKVDAHKLAIYLSAQNIMARSGYFCCHYYLDHKLKLPPMLRLSVGVHNTPEQIEKTLVTIKTILRNAS